MVAGAVPSLPRREGLGAAEFKALRIRKQLLKLDTEPRLE